MEMMSNNNFERKYERRKATFRKEEFEYIHQYLLDKSTGQEFTTTKMDNANTMQVYNQYRVKHGIPFTDEIKQIRTRYKLSASAMAKVLGFGDNVYRLYENGDMPSVSNGKTLKAIQNPSVFKTYLEDAGEEFKDLAKSIDVENDVYKYFVHSSIFGSHGRGSLNGYASQSISKLKNTILYFIEKMDGVFVTKMNKLLFYADLCAYRDNGQAITGLSYRAIQRGPVPTEWTAVYSLIGDISQEVVTFPNGFEGQKLVSDMSFDSSSLSEEELTILESVVRKFKKETATNISDISHKEDAWIENEKDHNVIDFSYAYSLKAM